MLNTSQSLSSGHQVVWSNQPDERDGTDLVIILHGYGSHERRIAEHCFPMLPETVTGLSVRGGFSVNDDEWGWFLLDYFLTNDFAEVIASAHRVFDLMDAEEVTAHGFRSVSLLGHSQGMAMASTVLRLRPEAFTAVVGLSGFVLSNPLLATLDNPEGHHESAGPRPFFWGRDTEDYVINPDATEHTGQWLEEHTRLTARTYPDMGHGFGPELTRDVKIFLNHVLSSTD